MDFFNREALNWITYIDHEFKRNKMGRVNVCLKRSYIILISLIAVSVFFLSLLKNTETVQSQVKQEELVSEISPHIVCN